MERRQECATKRDADQADPRSGGTSAASAARGDKEAGLGREEDANRRRTVNEEEKRPSQAPELCTARPGGDIVL